MFNRRFLPKICGHCGKPLHNCLGIHENIPKRESSQDEGFSLRVKPDGSIQRIKPESMSQ